MIKGLIHWNCFSRLIKGSYRASDVFFFEVVTLAKMSKEHFDSRIPRDRGPSLKKRVYDGGTDDNGDVSSSRHKRPIAEEEKKDFINYQKGNDFFLKIFCFDIKMLLFPSLLVRHDLR